MAILDKYAHLREVYDGVRAAGRDPFSVRFDAVTSPTEGLIDGQPVILLGTNNYLGLTFDPDCVEEAVAALRESGTGTTGSRIANGSYRWHARLEEELARFFGRRHAMMFTTGYQANLGIISALAGRGDHLLIDADCHASIYDACRLGQAQVTRFRHNDPADLERRLRRLEGQKGDRIVVVEGIYSMAGDTAPLGPIAEVTKAAGAYLVVDEAHSMGVLGAHGRGVAEAQGVEDKVDFVVGTFSKSLGAIGGFCVSDIDDFDVLRVASRPYMFTASLPPSVVASVLVALGRIRGATDLRQQVMENATRLYRGLEAAGFLLGPEISPVVAVRLPDPATAIAFWNTLLGEGLYVNLALPPATPTSEPLLRSSVSAAHSPEQIDAAVAAITRVGEAMKVIPGSRRSAVG
ncbi:MAG TPA: pyridoxal phosphate-dependent aminotransferase family protein [Thermohalobaculum sp.]|nr:pyridoxal phosphate-dependent aminotransferase family protein [Thermohalobaculum sp.]